MTPTGRSDGNSHPTVDGHDGQMVVPNELFHKYRTHMPRAHAFPVQNCARAESGHAAAAPPSGRAGRAIAFNHHDEVLAPLLLPPLDLAVDRLAHELGAVLAFAQHRLDAREGAARAPDFLI